MLLLTLQVFASSMGEDLILEFTKEMFPMNQFEQVSFHYCIFLIIIFLAFLQ